MTRPRVLVTTAWLRPRDAVHHQLESAGCEVVHSSFVDRATSGEDLVDLVADVDGIVAGTDPFTEEIFAAATKLKVIGRTGTGYDNIDVDAATRHGVAVCPTPGVNRQSVAEHTMGLLLATARQIPQNVAIVRAGGWNQSSGRELGGATLGIVGLGAIGKVVATMARGFGMSVVAHDPFVDSAAAEAAGITILSLDELLACSDFVTLHMFLSSDTHHLIDAAALAKMKPGSFLVNAARGGVIDENALADALASGHLAGAALDTTEIEPLPAESRLRTLDNVIVTAHVGAATIESRARSGSMAAQSVVYVLQGGMPDQAVNPQVAAATTSR
jgi:D-3-phosphoglycerate dehydrogenase